MKEIETATVLIELVLALKASIDNSLILQNIYIKAKAAGGQGGGKVLKNFICQQIGYMKCQYTLPKKDLTANGMNKLNTTIHILSIR